MNKNQMKKSMLLNPEWIRKIKTGRVTSFVFCEENNMGLSIGDTLEIRWHDVEPFEVRVIKTLFGTFGKIMQDKMEAVRAGFFSVNELKDWGLYDDNEPVHAVHFQLVKAGGVE